MRFDYMRMTQAFDSIDLPDIGNVAVNAFNDFGQEWFLIINTNLGWTQVKEFGPIGVDTDEILDPFKYVRFSYEFSESKLERVIDKFLNEPKRMITQVMEVEKAYAEDRLDSVRKRF